MEREVHESEDRTEHHEEEHVSEEDAEEVEESTLQANKTKDTREKRHSKVVIVEESTDKSKEKTTEEWVTGKPNEKVLELFHKAKEKTAEMEEGEIVMQDGSENESIAPEVPPRGYDESELFASPTKPETAFPKRILTKIQSDNDTILYGPNHISSQKVMRETYACLSYKHGVTLNPQVLTKTLKEEGLRGLVFVARADDIQEAYQKLTEAVPSESSGPDEPPNHLGIGYTYAVVQRMVGPFHITKKELFNNHILKALTAGSVNNPKDLMQSYNAVNNYGFLFVAKSSNIREDEDEITDSCTEDCRIYRLADSDKGFLYTVEK